MKPLISAGLALLAFGLGMLADRLLVRGAGNGIDRRANSASNGQVSALGAADRAQAGASGGDAGSSETGGGGKAIAGGVQGLIDLVDPSRWHQNGEAVKDVLRDASPAEIMRMVASLDAMDGSDPRTAGVKRAIYERYAEIDPKGALKAAAEFDDRDLTRHVVHHAFQALAKTDLSTALALYADLEDGDEIRETAMRSLARNSDPSETPRLAEIIKELPEQSQFGELFSRWAHHDPAAATAFVLDIKNENTRREWLGATAYGWSRLDPYQAMAWMNSLQGEADRARAAEGIMHSINRSDPATAATLVSLLRRGTQQHFAGEVARNWAREDLGAAREWAESMTGEAGQNAMRGVLRTWSRDDPAAAGAYLNERPPSEHTSDAMRELAHEWARRDVAAAAEWALSTDGGAGRHHALNGIADQWARKDPAAAAQFAAELTNPQERHEVLDNIASNWARRNLDDAIAWVDGLDNADRAHAARGVMLRVTNIDPTKAVELFAQFTTDIPAQTLDSSGYEDVARRIAESWSDSHPAEAGQWAQALPEGSKMQREAVERVADHWAGSDSMAASEWIIALPQGEVRNAATEQLVNNIAGSDPASAFEWAMSSSDAGHRQEMMREVLEQWGEIDPAEARAALESTPLTAEQREDLGKALGG